MTALLFLAKSYINPQKLANSIILRFDFEQATTMSSLSFTEKRLEETFMIYKKFFGDRKKYNFYKHLQEERKRMKQKQIDRSEVAYQIAKHNQRFPLWHCVRDASDLYVPDRFKISQQYNVPKQQRRVFDVPVVPVRKHGMCDILKDILASSLKFDYLTVSCVYDQTTVNVPQKMVVMIHNEGNMPFDEGIKHQERPLSPAIITHVIGGRFDNQEKAILVTSDKIMHTRYLYKDFAKYQFHDAVPKHNKEMRICYGVKPETVSVITLHFNDCDIVLFPFLRKEDWKATEDTVLYTIESILYMNKYHIE